jgi:short-subunit dehydrogenase
MSYWQDKVVVITGGSSGLGFHYARELAFRGANVVTVARNAARLNDAVESLNCPNRMLCLVADITNPVEVAKLPSRVMERFGRVDALVNCAGKSSRGELLNTSLESFREFWELNTLALIDCTIAFAPELKKTRGHLVNIGSLGSKLASRYLGAYPTSKFPVAAFSQQLRLEVQEEFHVLLVCPGPIARADAGVRYDDIDVPVAAKQPGGGARIKGLDPQHVVRATLRACERRKAEIILPRKARMLLLLAAISPSWGDWLLRKFSS